MELALVIPLVVLLVAFLVEVAVVARVQIELVGAAREGARVAATTPDPARALEAATKAMGPRGTEARVTVHRPHVVGKLARVEIAITHQIGLPLVSSISVPLSARAAMRVER